MSARCVVIGDVARASQLKKLLDENGILTKAFVHNLGYKGIATACAEEKHLRAIAVFCRDFPLDGGVGLFTALRKSLNGKIAFHALVETKKDMGSVDSTLKRAGADEVFFAFPLDPTRAARSIVQCWFKGSHEGPVVGEHDEEERFEMVQGHLKGTSSDIPRIGNFKDTVASLTTGLSKVVPPKSIKPTSEPYARAKNQIRQGCPLREAPVRPDTFGANLARELGPNRVVVTAEPVGEEQVTTELQEVSGEKPVGTFLKLLETFQRNSPLPREPKVVSIVGKHGTIVELDPRRVRPLPENPRWATNPGFSEESIRELGENMKTVGQVEEALFCPITDDPEFDAQLIDGERRQRGCKSVRIMLRGTVREDITPEMVRQRYFLSVVRNIQKEVPTTRELMRIVSNFRGPDFEMSIDEVAGALHLSRSWITKLELLNRLHSDVQEMLDDGGTEESSAKRNGRKFTSQIASLLVDIAPENQRVVAEKIIAENMNYNQARRYVLNLRRGLGLKMSPQQGNRFSKQFQALATLTRQSMERFGIFLDMPTVELSQLLANRTAGEKSGVCQDLRALVAQLNDLIQRIESEGKS